MIQKTRWTRMRANEMKIVVVTAYVHRKPTHRPSSTLRQKTENARKSQKETHKNWNQRFHLCTSGAGSIGSQLPVFAVWEDWRNRFVSSPIHCLITSCSSSRAQWNDSELLQPVAKCGYNYLYLFSTVAEPQKAPTNCQFAEKSHCQCARIRMCNVDAELRQSFVRLSFRIGGGRWRRRNIRMQIIVEFVNEWAQSRYTRATLHQLPEN